MINFFVEAVEKDIGGQFEGIGPLGETGRFAGNINLTVATIAKIISNFIGVLTIVAGFWFLLQFIIGGINFMTAGQDTEKIGKYFHQITSAAIGLAIVVAAYAITHLIGRILGFDIFDLQALVGILGL